MTRLAGLRAYTRIHGSSAHLLPGSQESFRDHVSCVVKAILPSTEGSEEREYSLYKTEECHGLLPSFLFHFTFIPQHL